jgi:hypothetical protein
MITVTTRERKGFFLTAWQKEDLKSETEAKVCVCVTAMANENTSFMYG